MTTPHPAQTKKKPAWLRRSLPRGPEYEGVRKLVNAYGLHTVCQEAQCPNNWECFSKNTATFLLLGNRCTRNCRFCAVEGGSPEQPDPDEPAKVAEAAAKLGLRYVVLTSVTRDDLPDGGAGSFAETVKVLRETITGVLVEVLIPDFNGDQQALKVVVESRPDVINHNIETVPRLYPEVRPQASYQRSLDIFHQLTEAAPHIPTKSGLMLGLGETGPEVETVLRDLVAAGCSFLTMGQYLKPSRDHLPVERYVPPEEFEDWQHKALSFGFKGAACGPFVRSSYCAAEMMGRIKRE